MTLRSVRWWLCAAAFFASTPDEVLASDYAHECRSADGLYEMSDEQLFAAGEEPRTAIAYRTLKDTVLSERKGYCLSHGQHFQFEARSYLRRVRFQVDGNPVEVEMLCELAADGLPAAYNCEKEVVTLQTNSGTASASTAVWTHNGSVMRLDAKGASRVFSYEKPRAGMRRVGARPGDVVFEGTREGTAYSGTAYMFSPNCGRTPYAVSGNVTPDDRRVMLEGQAPVLDADCKVTGYRRDRLRFDYLKR